MGKGLRASSERANRRKLRTNVFGPVEKARADRLHAKLLATINSEKPAPPAKKAAEEDTSAPAAAKEEAEKDMDIDTKTSKKPNTSQNVRKTKNQHARKARNSMAFPATRGKGALKPFSAKGRVSKRK